jgi:hypothetical protein
VEWTDVLNKPDLFSGSCNDLIDTPSIDLTGPQGPQGKPGLNEASEWSDISNKSTWVATSQGSVNLSEFNNVLSLTVGDVEWVDVKYKPAFFSGLFNDLTNPTNIEDLTGPRGLKAIPVPNAPRAAH